MIRYLDYLMRVDKDQWRVSFVFKLWMFGVSRRENDGEGRVLVEHLGHRLHDGVGLLQVCLLHDEEVILIKCWQCRWRGILVQSDGWKAQWMSEVSKENIKGQDSGLLYGGIPGVRTKHHCCCALRAQQVEQGEQLRDSLLHHCLALHWRAGDCLLEIYLGSHWSRASECWNIFIVMLCQLSYAIKNQLRA